MIDAQHAYLPPVLAYAIPLPPSPVESPSPCDSPRLLEDAACSVTAANFSEKLTLSGADEISDPPTCCQGESGEDSRQTPRMLPDGRSVSPTAGAPSPLESPKASFEEFAVLYCQRRHHEVLRRYLEQRLRATRVSIGLSARLLRVGTAVQKGLVDGFKHGDKANFMVIYNTIHEIQESFNSASRRLLHRQDPLEGNPLALDSERNHSPSFLHQLSPKSRSDLLEILNLVRTDPQFLFERISSLTPSRLSALVSSATALEGGDSVFASRTRNQFLFSKRTTTQSLPYKDHALAFERTDALSALLFNVFAPSLNSDSAESRLRLDVWSSTCAKLLSHGGSKHHSFVGYILSSWSLCSHWKIKPKFELYLMDVLQKGAFLLENVESPLGLSFDAEPPDPFRTDAAEEFFESAVETLFEILDDPEGGFPHGTLEMGRAIFGKLTVPETRDRFLDYMLVQWFFSKFLHNALCYPETHDLLLDFHISKDAREKLLGQIGLRAQSQVFRVLHSLPQFSMARPSIRQHVDSMISWFDRSSPKAHPELDSDPSANGAFNCFEPSPSLPSPFLILSAADILTILNALFPKSICASFESSSPSGMSSFSFSPPQSHSGRTSRIFESQLFQGRIDALSSQPATTRTVFSPDVTRANSLASDSTCSLVSQPRCPLSQNVDRIRFELESDDRPSLDHPMAEDWAVLLVTHNGRSLNWVVSHEDDPENDHVSDDGARSTTIGSEENYEALQTAIVKLVHEEEALNRSSYGSYFYRQQMIPCPLKQRFDNALSLCQQQADFIGAHYWWNASRQLRRGAAKFSPHPVNDSWILQPLVTSCKRSLELSCSIIERCESSFVMLDRTLDQLQTKMKEMTKDLARLRNKMWYMTDVKNSMRYEDAKHVALALKTMVYSSSLQRHSSNEHRGRNGARSLAGSFLQKPEVQVMNVMKAPSSQGGPNKLSDEQVDLTRKWLTHHGIDNFCKGEERIHRFCYEVKSSINRLIGDTMSEAPVLWSSELFQKERAKYETSSVRGYPGISAATGVRPSSIASEDALYASQTFGLSRVSEAFSRPYNDAPSLARKSSFQSLASDKWRAPRDAGATDTSSIGDSPGRTASSSTADTYSTFWSAPHTQAQSAASASSFQSRPPSMFSDTVPPPRRSERNIHGKSAFLDELRQTLTSLLLSDLGSPVWSCGSETDAWFTNCLNQKRIQVQMAKRARIRKFLDECDSASNRDEIEMGADRYVGRRRSRSVGPIMSRQHTPVAPTPIAQESSVSQDEAENSSFPYRAAFFQLIESFSRHANPFVKLKALRDLRTLVIASLCNSAEDRLNAKSSALGQAKLSDLQQNRSLRYSFSQPWRLRYSPESLAQAPSSPVAGSSFSSRQSDHLCPTESEIVDTLRTLLQDIQPKTLFRDLQFVSAFVPSEILNKTESGTAFLHFGLAALSLKDEVCNSMVEIADKIVSQELSRRHPPHSYEYHRPGHAIEDAAAMWIITAKEGNPVAQRELAILYLTHPELLPRVTLPLTLPRDTFKAEMMYRRDKDPKSDPQSMCLALHWMQLSANGGDELARNRLREREEFDSIA